MAQVTSLVFRKLTHADYFNISKPRGTEERGGGQSYIDFPIGDVSLEQWGRLFSSFAPTDRPSGPMWQVEINSLGGLGLQEVRIGQRRSKTVSVRAQKLHSHQSNRVLAWHPDHGAFPNAPDDIASAHDPRIPGLLDGLRIFILKTDGGELWAGWLGRRELERMAARDNRLLAMATDHAGYIAFDPSIELDDASAMDPFKLLRHQDSLLSPYRSVHPDVGQNPTAEHLDMLQEDFSTKSARRQRRVVATFHRNRAAVQKLKALYGKCQITGHKYVFPTARGVPYLEAHHLVPLGEGGADHPANLVIVSAHVHRMLHHADVQGIDLHKFPTAVLQISINGTRHRITWHPGHINAILNPSP